MDDCLIARGITLDLQSTIDRCHVDFLINDCLVVEIDGAAYHSSDQAKARDFAIGKFVRSQGFRVLRISAKYPLYDGSATINKVRRAISITAELKVNKN